MKKFSGKICWEFFLDKSTLVIYKKHRAITEEEWQRFAAAIILSDPENEDTIKQAQERMTK